MVFNATLNNISVISWRSVLLVEETGVPGENYRPVASYIMLYRVHLVWAGFELTALVLIGTDCICNCKSNYPTIGTTTIPYASGTLWSWHLNQIIFLIGTLIATTWRSTFSFFFTYFFLPCWIYFWICFCFLSSDSFSTV